MAKLSVFLWVMLLAGCAGYNSADNSFHVKLVRNAPEKMMLEISRQEPFAVAGSDGYVGHHKVTYWAALAGTGPTFVNPHFADSPAEYHCLGSITVDLDHSLVSINMRRIVSKPGEPEQAEPHPANGVHRIEKIRNSKHDEWWF